MIMSKDDYLKFVASQRVAGFGAVPGARTSTRTPHRTGGMIRSIERPNTESVFESHTKNILFISRGFVTKIVAVGTIPVLIVDSRSIRSYTIINPSGSVSGNQPSLVDAWGGPIVANASGNNQATPLDIANYLYLQLFCNVIAVTGSWTFYAQSQNPGSGNYADCAKLWTAVDAIGELFSDQESLPVPTTRAIRWVADAPGVITFQLGYTAKEFLGGTATGLSQTLYIGSNGDISTVSGYPVHEGDSFSFIADENIQIWGVALTPITINVFEF
jgi:hypothetical protein